MYDMSAILSLSGNLGKPCGQRSTQPVRTDMFSQIRYTYLQPLNQQVLVVVTSSDALDKPIAGHIDHYVGDIKDYQSNIELGTCPKVQVCRQTINSSIANVLLRSMNASSQKSKEQRDDSFLNILVTLASTTGSIRMTSPAVSYFSGSIGVALLSALTFSNGAGLTTSFAILLYLPLQLARNRETTEGKVRL
jgi:hypothetical protein